MSFWTTIIESVAKLGLKVLPAPYKWAAIGLGIVAAFGSGYVYFRHEVDLEANKVINAYIQKDKKEAGDISEITISNNHLIDTVYVDKVKTITKTVTKIVEVAKTDVPDVETILSTGWVKTFNAAVLGVNVTPEEASDKTPSGVSAVDALVVEVQNIGTCQKISEELTGLQNWVTTEKALINKENAKNGVK